MNKLPIEEREKIAWNSLEKYVEKRDVKNILKFAFYLKWIEKQKVIDM